MGQTPSDVVFAENKWRLLRYRARPEGTAWATPVLLVPSLINRHYVLDLLPGKSFVEWFVARGHDVFCIEWGTPGDEDRYLTFDDVCDRYLGRALERTRRIAGAPKAHVLGYCLGGTLAAIHASVHPERFASLTALAAPIGVHDCGLLIAWTRSRTSRRFLSVSIRTRSTPERISLMTFWRGAAPARSLSERNCGRSWPLTNAKKAPRAPFCSSRRFAPSGAAQSRQR